MSCLMYILPLAADDPFRYFRQGFADFMIAVLCIIAAVSLIVTVIHIANGDQDSAKKFAKWFVTTIVGLTLITLIGRL